MNKTRVKTKYNGLVWVHEKYVQALKDGEMLIIEHDGTTMTISPEQIKLEPPVKGKEVYTEQYGTERGKKYRLYGFNFVPDQGGLF